MAWALWKILKYILKLRSMTGIRLFLDYKLQHRIGMSHPIIVSMGGLSYEFMQYQLLEKFLRASFFVDSLFRGRGIQKGVRK